MGDSLRVSRITFFTHGLACLEHTATVQGDTQHMLSINPSAMADLLKTLTVHPGTDGIVKSVTYDAPPSRDDQTEDHRLAESYPRGIAAGAIGQISGAIGPQSTDVITALLNENIGSPMTVFHDKGSVTGRVMGLQSMQDVGTNSSNEAVVILQDDGLIVPVRLSHVQGVRIQGPKAEDIATRFRRVAERGRIGVTIVTEGDEERKLTVRYAIEAPVYKVTYRVILLDEHNLYIQAWAIVDNPSDEKLDDVEVVIISGLPMSFRHDVYRARYISRPVEPVSKDAGIAAAGVEYAAQLQGCGTSKLARRRCHRRNPIAHCALRRDEDLRDEEHTIPRWSDAAEAAAAGSVHEYRIPGRVTIPARESALLPLIMATTPGGRVDMHVDHIRSKNTLRAVKIVNNTAAPFERGPVAVYDEDTLVGEGMLPPCQPGADVLMPYSVNLDCKVEKRESSGKGAIVTECFVSSGEFRFKKYIELVTIYDFSEQSERLEVITLHAHSHMHELVSGELLPTEHVDENTAQGTKITPEKREGGVCQFRITLEPGTKSSLRVVESYLDSHVYEISLALKSGILASITNQGFAGKDSLARLRRLVGANEELNRVEREIGSLKSNKKELEATQQRYCESFQALSGGQGRIKDSGVVAQYAQRIREGEAKIDELKLLIQAKEGVAEELRGRITVVIAEFENNELKKKVDDGEDRPSA